MAASSGAIKSSQNLTPYLVRLPKTWQKYYGLLCNHYRFWRRSHTDPFYTLTGSLEGWGRKQLAAYRSGKLSQAAIHLLIRVGYPVITGDPVLVESANGNVYVQRNVQLWFLSLDRLRNYLKTNGWQWPRARGIREQNNLYKWWRKYSKRFRQEFLPEPMAQALNSLEREWHKGYQEQRWEANFRKLAAYHKRYGKWPAGSTKPGLWLSKQRVKQRKGKLLKHHFSQLDRLGIPWEGPVGPPRSLPQITRRRLRELKAFRASHPDRWPRENESAGDKEQSLSLWCAAQRTKYKQNRLSPELVGILNSMGFAWSRRDMYLKDRIREFLSFYKKNKGRLPSEKAVSAEERSLNNWLRHLQELHREGKLPAEQEKRLAKIGFPFKSPHETAWLRQFEHLKVFRKKYPDRWPEFSAKFPGSNKLGTWCSRQREDFRAGRLQQERLVLLKGIGFPLDSQEWIRVQSEQKLSFRRFDHLWQKRFQDLRAFRARHPDRWPVENKSAGAEELALAWWCGAQRGNRKRNRLLPERVEALNSMGFPWNPKGNN